MCSGGLHAAGLAHKLVCFAQDFWKVSISETTWMMLVLRLAASSFLVGSRCSKSAIALFSSFVTNMWGALKPLQTLPSAHALCALDIFCSPSPMQAMHILSSSRSSRAASWDTLDPAPVRWCVHARACRAHAAGAVPVDCRAVKSFFMRFIAPCPSTFALPTGLHYCIGGTYVKAAHTNQVVRGGTESCNKGRERRAKRAPRISEIRQSGTHQIQVQVPRKA